MSQQEPRLFIEADLPTWVAVYRTLARSRPTGGDAERVTFLLPALRALLIDEAGLPAELLDDERDSS